MFPMSGLWGTFSTDDFLCIDVIQELIDGQQASDGPHSENLSTSHVSWHLHLPSNETGDAQV